MQTVSNDTFGPMIAYLVPGATALTGLSPFLPVVQTWLEGTSTTAPTIGGLLYLSLSSFGVGMTVSAVRWATVDSLHSWLGIKPPKLDFANLPGHVEELRLLIEIHYRHYQFYANMLVSIVIAYSGYRIHVGFAGWGLADLAIVTLAPIFYLTSRDTLRKYYGRTEQLLNHSRRARSLKSVNRRNHDMAVSAEKGKLNTAVTESTTTSNSSTPDPLTDETAIKDESRPKTSD